MPAIDFREWQRGSRWHTWLHSALITCSPCKHQTRTQATLTGTPTDERPYTAHLYARTHTRGTHHASRTLEGGVRLGRALLASALQGVLGVRHEMIDGIFD